MVKKLSVFFTKPLQDLLEQDPDAIRSGAMEGATQLPLRVLGFHTRAFLEPTGPEDRLEKFFDGCSGESNGLTRAVQKSARVEATLSLLTEDKVGIVIRFFEKGRGGHFAELSTSFDAELGLHGGVGWNEVVGDD